MCLDGGVAALAVVLAALCGLEAVREELLLPVLNRMYIIYYIYMILHIYDTNTYTHILHILMSYAYVYIHLIYIHDMVLMGPLLPVVRPVCTPACGPRSSPPGCPPHMGHRISVRMCTCLVMAQVLEEMPEQSGEAFASGSPLLR